MSLFGVVCFPSSTLKSVLYRLNGTKIKALYAPTNSSEDPIPDGGHRGEHGGARPVAPAAPMATEDALQLPSRPGQAHQGRAGVLLGREGMMEIEEEKIQITTILF